MNARGDNRAGRSGQRPDFVGTASARSELKAETAKALRLCLTGAALAGIGVVFLLIGLGGPTFVNSPLWWAIIAVLVIAGSVVFAKGLHHDHRAKRLAAATGNDRLGVSRQMSPPRGRVILWTFLLIGWITCCFIGAGPALAVRELGHTGTAVAGDAQSWTPCSKCSQRAEASFSVNGQPVTAELRGVSQDDRYYRAGITIVYDVSKPTVAMAQADYRDGKGPVPAELIGGSTAVFFVGTWLLVVIPRRAPQPRRRGRRPAA